MENWTGQTGSTARHQQQPQAEELRGHFIAQPEKRLKQNSLLPRVIPSLLKYLIQKIASIFQRSAICPTVGQQFPSPNPKLQLELQRTPFLLFLTISFSHFTQLLFGFDKKCFLLLLVVSMRAKNWNHWNMLNLYSASDVTHLCLWGPKPRLRGKRRKAHAPTHARRVIQDHHKWPFFAPFAQISAPDSVSIRPQFEVVHF